MPGRASGGAAVALDVATGEVVHECLPRHRHQEFLRFLRKVERSVASELDIHVILDNYATHKHPAVRAWLDKHPRVHPSLPTYVRHGARKELE